jgi:hypothetical protein
MENKINLFLSNKTKGADKREKLFHEIGKEIYEVLHKNNIVKYDFIKLLDEYINQSSFFANDFYDFKNLMFFALNKNNSIIDKKTNAIYKKLALGVLGNDINYWINKIKFENINNEESLVLYNLQ